MATFKFTVKTVRGRVVLETNDIEEARLIIAGNNNIIEYNEVSVENAPTEKFTLTMCDGTVFKIVDTIEEARELIIEFNCYAISYNKKARENYLASKAQ